MVEKRGNVSSQQMAISWLFLQNPVLGYKKRGVVLFVVCVVVVESYDQIMHFVGWFPTPTAKQKPCQEEKVEHTGTTKKRWYFSLVF